MRPLGTCPTPASLGCALEASRAWREGPSSRGFPSTCWGVVFAPVLSSCSCSESLLATSLPAFYGSSAVTHADGSTSLVLGPPRSLFRGQHPDSVGSGVCTFKQLPWGF